MIHRNTNLADAPVGLQFRSFETDQLPLEFKLDTVRRFGSETLSYASAIQPGLRHFANRDGYLAYQKKYGHTFVLGDPVVDSNNLDLIIDEFLNQQNNVTFCQVGEDVAARLNDRDYWVNELGFDSCLHLDHYDFSGKEKERFRYAVNWLNKRNFEIGELDLSPEVIEKTERLSRQWMKTKTVKKETAFMNRALELAEYPDMRRFYLVDSSGEFQAFVFFDPLYHDNEVIGYVTAFKRRHPKAPSHAEQGICKVAIERFKEEGKSVVRLGLSPFAEVSDDRFRYNWLLKSVFRYYYNAGWVNRFFYNLKGHAEFKNRFRGINEKTYFASPSWFNDIRLFALIRLCKIM